MSLGLYLPGDVIPPDKSWDLSAPGMGLQLCDSQQDQVTMVQGHLWVLKLLWLLKQSTLPLRQSIRGITVSPATLPQD